MKRSTSTATATKIRAVELIRVSSQGQADRDTPDDQKAALSRLRLSRPANVVEVIEFAVSGAKAVKDRPDIQRLAWLADHGGFDEVRVRNFTRLTRHEDPDEQEAVFGIIRRAHAKIVEADGSVIDPSEMTGRILSIVKAQGAADERRRIVTQTLAGKRRLAERGWLVNAQPPFGRFFDRRDGTWKVNKDQLAVYRRIIEMAGRVPLRQIAATLTAEGIPSPQGKGWHWGAIAGMVHHPSVVGRYFTMGQEIAIPAVVDAATQLAAIARLAQANKLSGPKPKIFTLLRKLAVCSECGKSIYAAKCGGTKGATRVYFCSRGCFKGHPGIPVQATDARIASKLAIALSDPNLLRQGLRRGRDEAGGGDPIADAKQEIATADRELRDLDRQEERLLRVYRRGVKMTGRIFEGQMKEIENLRAAARAARDAARLSIEDVKRSAEVEHDLEQTIAEIRAGFAHLTPGLWTTESTTTEERQAQDEIRAGIRRIVEWLFPRGSIRLRPDGTVDGAGLIGPNASGDCRAART